jgi:hypothetical protein
MNTIKRVFACHPGNAFLWFTIKKYPSHKDVTNKILQLKKDDELMLQDFFGTIVYKDPMKSRINMYVAKSLKYFLNKT